MKKKWLALLLALALIVSCLPGTICFAANQYDGVSSKLMALKSQFPEGKYYNHYVSTAGYDAYLRKDESYQNSVTSHPCNHNANNAGNYDCNYFDGGSQCWAFARKLFYEVFGQRVSSLSRRTDFANIAVGDYLRYGTDADGHSVIVIARNGNTVKVAECNWDYVGGIRWSGEYNIYGTVAGKSLGYFVHASNWDSINQSTVEPYAQFAPWSSENYTYIRDTDACIGQNITAGGGSWTEVGMILYSADGTELARASNDPSVSPSTHNYCYYANSELGVTLIPGTTYKYKFYAVVGGQTFYSNMGSFTTTGTTPPQTISGFCGGDMTATLIEDGSEWYDSNDNIYDNLTWTLDSNGLLSISGTGKMADFTVQTAPWFNKYSLIKSAVIGSGVTNIGNAAFCFCTNMESVTISDSVTSIGDWAFEGCQKLTSVTIPSSVTSIGAYVFNGCEKLERLTLPANVTEIGQAAFGHSGIKSFNVATGNTNFKSVDGVLFNADLTTLLCYPPAAEREEYVVPDSVTSIGYLAVQAKALRKITVPKTVTSLDKGAIEPIFEFVGSETVSYCPTVYCYENSAAHNFAVNNNLPYSVIEESNIIASGYCGGDTTANLVEVVEGADPECGHYDVYDNTIWTLDKDGVLTISGTGMMVNCIIGTIELGDHEYEYANGSPWRQYSNDIKSVVIEKEVLNIGDYTFINCNKLTSVTIPVGITSIGNHAFTNCDMLLSVGIPDSVTIINDYAFSSSDGLMSVTFEGNAPSEFGNYVFWNTANDFTIHAPKNNTTWTSTTAYDAQAQTWNGYPIVFDVDNTCEHTWGEGVVTTQPTHLAEGVKTFTCTKCGATRTEPVARLTDHTYDQQIVDAKYLKSTATCINAAVYFKSCLCGEVGTETFTYGDPAGHTYGTPSYEWDGASCTASRVCTKCSAETSGHTQTETATGHYVKDTDATCTVCEKGHYEASFTNQAFVTQSTAKDSVDQGTPLGHSFPETWEKHNETQHKHTCTRCHTEVEYENHAWNDGVITTPATADTEGVKTFTCTKCGETKTEPVAKLAEQNIWKPSDTITWTYGAQGMTINFTNMSSEGGSLSYSSSNTDVATVTGGLTGCTVNIVGAGETTITATAAAVSGKYVETSVSVKLTINPASLTVTAKNVSVSYGSEASGFDYTVSGLVLGENATDVLSGTPEYQCDYSQYDNVGSYPITVSGLNAANYTISCQPGTLTVEKLADYTLSFDENTLLQSIDHSTPILATVTPQDSTAQILVEYYVGASWTDTLPTTSGTYPVRASLTASNNLVVPQTPTYIDDSLRIIDGAFIGNKDIVIDVTENPDGTVEVGELTPEQVQAVTNDAANNDKSVTLDLTGNGVASGAKGLTIPASLVDAMNGSTDVESFTVKTQDAEIEMDSSVLNTLAGSLDEGSKLTIEMETVNQNDLSTSQKEALESIRGGSDVVVLDLKLIAKQYDEHGTETGSNEIHQLGGIASIQVAYDFEEAEGKILVALYVDENGNTTYLPVTYKDGFVSFRTDHFSVYAVTEIEKTDCGHSWDEGVVTLEPTTTSTGIRTYTCLICGETKTETIAKKPGGGNIGGGGGGAASAKVQIADGISHGKISADMDSASAGQTVTLTVVPDKGYKLSTLTAKDAKGNVLTLTKVSDTTYTFKMPSSKVTIVATFVKSGSVCPQDETCVYAKFTDADTKAWYHDGVHFCVENGYMQGVSATAFDPAGTTTRAMIVTMLWRLEGEPVVNYAMSFKDVTADQWYTEAIRWAQSTGIVEGYSDEAFGPNDPITREQMATILYRYAKYHGVDVASTNTLAGFTDVNKVSTWALDAMKWANAAGLVQGRTTTTLVPDVSITRAEAATMVQRYCEKVRED